MARRAASRTPRLRRALYEQLPGVLLVFAAALLSACGSSDTGSQASKASAWSFLGPLFRPHDEAPPPEPRTEVGPGEAEDLLAYAVFRYAPRIWFHPDEEWFPTSAPDFLSYTSRRGDHLVTLNPLQSPSDSEWEGAEGRDPEEELVPIYAFVVSGKRESASCPAGGSDDERFTDVVYFVLHPYNRGKQICLGYSLRNYCLLSCPWPLSGCCLPRLNGCYGSRTVFGSHVGDWEHVTVRLRGDRERGYEPVWVVGSAHSTRNRTRWEHVFKTPEGHPVLFSALGSHGLYFRPGCVRYRRLPNGVHLEDCMGRGKVWDSWRELVTLQWRGHWTCSGGGEDVEECERWANGPAQLRWGNPKRGCGRGVYETLSGECRLNPGPVGPNGKTWLRDPGVCE